MTSEDQESTGFEVPTVRPKTAPGIVMGTISSHVARAGARPARPRGLSLRYLFFQAGFLGGAVRQPCACAHGESSADMISAILNDDPPEIRLSNSSLSGILDRIVRRCLEKDLTTAFNRLAMLVMRSKRYPEWPVPTLG